MRDTHTSTFTALFPENQCNVTLLQQSGNSIESAEFIPCIQHHNYVFSAWYVTLPNKY
jgi:hypothetical protein